MEKLEQKLNKEYSQPYNKVQTESKLSVKPTVLKKFS